MNLLLVSILLFTLEGIFCGYSTHFGKTRVPKPDKDVVRPVIYPSPHPKQRFIGHHEGWVRDVRVSEDDEIKGKVPEISNPTQVEIVVDSYEPKDENPSIPVVPPKTEIWDKDYPSINIQPVVSPPKDIAINPTDFIIEEHEKYPEPIDDVKDVQVEEKPILIADPPKDIPIKEKPILIADSPGDIPINEKPILIADPPIEIPIDEKPILIADPPIEIPINEKPILIADPPRDIPVKEIAIVDPSSDVQIEDEPILVVNPPKDIQVEEKPIPFIPSEPDQDEIKILPEIPYPVKVTNENFNLNLFEMLQKLQLSRFVHLVQEAKLEDLLSGDESLTIFAPSNYALSNLKADEIKRLATNPDLLRQFVLYHCVDGSIFGSSLLNDPLKTRIDRNLLLANYYGEKWYVNGVEINVRDQVCKNGAIHIIDKPLYPFPSGGILETLETSGKFKIFTELLRNAKLDEVLKRESRWTIFAPTDVAFSKLPPANVEWLKWDIPAIKRLFNQVTCRGYYYTSWISSGSTSPPLSLANESLDFSGFPDSTINGISLSQRDITADNGCIHAIDDIWFSSDLTPGEVSVGKKD